MSRKILCSLIIALTIAMLAIPVVSATTTTWVTSTLGSPADDSSQTSMIVTFTYTPATNNTGLFQNSSLWTNITGTFALTQLNTTAVINDTLNSLIYTFTFTVRQAILWNIQVNDSAAGAFDGADRIVTVGTYMSTYPAVVQTLLSILLPIVYLIGAGVMFIGDQEKLTMQNVTYTAIGFILIAVLFPVAFNILSS